MRQGRKPPPDRDGIRLDGERFGLGGQPPIARPTKAWGVPLAEVARANAKAFEEAFEEEWRQMVGE